MKLKYIVTIALCLYTFGIIANNSINNILSNIERNNTELRAYNASIASDSANISTTNNLDDPKIDFEYNFGDIGDKWGIGISQGFDWPGSYSARNKANNSKIASLRQTYKIKRLDIILKAKLLYINIVMLNRQIDYQQLILNNIEDLYNQYTKAYNHGETSIIDINKIKIEQIATKQQLDELTSKRNSIIDKLVGLNNNEQFSDVDLTELKDYPVEELNSYEDYKIAFETNDPQYAYYASIDKAITDDVSVAKMGWLPKFELGYKYINELGDKFNGVTAGITVPIFSNRKKVASAKTQSITNDMNRQDYEVANHSRIKVQYAKAVSLRAQLNLYKDVVGDDNNFVVLRKALNGGQMSLLNYLLEMRYFLEATNKYIELEYNYHEVLAELNKYDLTK